MINFGKVKPGSVLDIPFETFSGSTGGPITMTGLAASTTNIKVYKNFGTTEQASAASFSLADTDGIDFDGLTGIHGFSLNLADNTTDGFYVAGGRYTVVVTGLTVDSVSVRFIAATFRIGYEGAMIDTTIATLASQTSFTLTDGPAEANTLIGCTVLVHYKASAVQIAMGSVSAYDVTTKTVTLSADPAIFTMAAGDNISVFQRANMYSINGIVVGVSGTVNANVVQISGDSTAADNLEAACDGTGYNVGGGSVVAASVTGAVGSVIGNVGGNVTGTVGSLATQAKADVNAEVLDVLSTDTFAELAGIPAATSSLKDKLTWMFMWFRNKVEQTATTKVLKADNGSTTVATFTESDDGTTYTSGEGV